MIKQLTLALSLPVLALLPLTRAHAQATTTQTFAGNGATGFGGALGNGSLTISSTSSAITFTLTPSGGTFGNNDVVIYLNTKSGGFTDTSSFTDNGTNNSDGGRTAVSGYNAGNSTRTLATFSSGFGADYAVDFDAPNSYASVYDLSSSPNLTYLTGGSAPVSSGTYSLTVSDAVLGITPGSSFDFVATLISPTAYRSNETIGNSTTTPDPAGSGSNAGFNGTTTFSNYNSFVTASDAMPEPGDLALLLTGVGVLGIAARRRFAKS